ncbi:hypothetical protein ACH42_17590 [Endozoicomonas sp. (ex Bugula neritina AB1)]|nr:hypothetical protein ACH42_17590 [Endozoicomonas sp. (ex Bugula neritina AB1)]
MPSQSVMNYLRSHRVPFSRQRHPPAYSAQEIAEKAHISGYRVVKTVVVKLDGHLALCVLPATERVNFGLLRQAAGCHKAELAEEDEFVASFPLCEPGAPPPFGELYGLSVFISDSLRQQTSLAFGCGDASERVVLTWQDFTELEHPVLMTGEQRCAIG